ncbi:hypothetical protein, variant [Verruconis gallopava]|nr:hypothetical protein, variant [Verruconis gallopava]KIW06101.1 hypothetical protein, variant [Verruconis gallopava]
MSHENRSKNGTSKKPSRQRPLPPDVMARNLAIEKQRREALNENFLDLARLVPALAYARRLSKGRIICESIRHFRHQREMCIAAAQGVQDLLAENDRLVSEVNALRAQLGETILPPREPMPATEAMIELMAVKDEVYGEFPAGFGDNWAYSPQEAHYNPAPAEIGGRIPSPNEMLTNSDPPCHTQQSSQSGSNLLYHGASPTMLSLEHCELDSARSVPCWDGQSLHTINPLVNPFTYAPVSTGQLMSTETLQSFPETMATSIDPTALFWTQGAELGINKTNDCITSAIWQY